MEVFTMNDNRFCQATAKGTGKRCKRAAIAGGTVCHMHGGAASQVKRKAALRVARQRAEVVIDRLGAQRDITPEEAILECITEAAGNVEIYRRLLAEIGLPVDADESAHLLIALYNQERDRLFTFASTAAKIGISELVIRISERQGEKLAEVLEGVFADPALGLDAVQRDVIRGVTAKHMKLVR
jgi:hypothetical protein